ncbi:MAG: RHS repeat-associated core domain-containing protein [Opitutaceae bacterium]|nr:RHS repeat-associated core domain-containing protein [Opitutaceae bacterium]
MRKLGLLLLGLVLLGGRLAAVVPVPYTEGVSFAFQLAGVGNGIMTIYDEATTPALHHTELGGVSESAIATAWLRPGRGYTLNFQASGPEQYWLSFIAPTGYRVYIDGQPRDMIYRYMGGGSYSHYYQIELRPVADPAPAGLGEFSGISLGKAVNWSVGLGGERNGRSAGRLVFRETDLTGSPVSRARLYYSEEPHTDQHLLVKDGPSQSMLRQILVAQGVVDLVDESNGYELRLYDWHANNPQWDNGLGRWTFTGSPWKTIRVESPGTDQLKITETEGSKSRVSHLALTNGPVVSGTYTWRLQEGDGTTWLRTLTQNSATAPPTVATGGTVTTDGSYTRHTFTSGGTFSVSEAIEDLEAVIVAGGGGGGMQHAGGGGAGGLLSLNGLNVAAGSHTIVVGDGGVGAVGYPTTGTNGGNSSALGHTAIGGGGGTGMDQYGNAGGSGGGDGYPSGGVRGGDGTSGQGHHGSRGNSLSIYDGGGGGGSGGVGNGLTGGPATATWAGTFAGGGGGGYGGGAGGGGGAGAGGVWHYSGANAVANSGSGGGGGGNFGAVGGNGGSGIVVLRYTTPNFRTVVETVRTGDENGPVVAKTNHVFAPTGGWGEELVKVVVDPDGAALATTYTYHTNSAQRGNYRKLRSTTHATGGWTAWEYYDDWDRRGQLKHEFRPHLDTPATVSLNPAQGRVVTFDYTPDWTWRHSRPTVREERVNNVVTGKTTWSHGDIAGSHGMIAIATITAYRDATNVQTTYTQAYRADAQADWAGQLDVIKHPDQRQTSYLRVRGTFNHTTRQFAISPTGHDWMVLAFNGSTNSSGGTLVSSFAGENFTPVYLLPSQSTLEVTVLSNSGLLLRQETLVYTGSSNFSMLRFEDFAHDQAGRPTSRVASNGAAVTHTYAHGLLASTVGADGTETQFTVYDALWRLVTSVKKGVAASGSYASQSDIATTNTYDGANRVTQQVVSGDSLSLVSAQAYDLAGRATSGTAPGGYTTTHAYSAGGRIVTTTLPGGGTRITEHHPDGQFKSVTGTAVVARHAAYAVISGGVREVTHREVSASGPVTEILRHDWLGRQTLRQVPSPSGSGYAEQAWHFNPQGQLWKHTRTGAAALLHEYDTMGRAVREGLDVNGNNTLDLASNDRITTTAVDFIHNGSAWWQRTIRGTYASADSAAHTTTGTTYDRLNNFGTNVRRETHTYDLHGNLTMDWSVVEAGAKLITRHILKSDSNIGAQQVTRNGLLMSARDTAGITLTYGYDALGRQNTVTDPRTGDITTAYVAGTSLVHTVTDPADVVQATYTYDSAGRVSGVQNALGKSAYYSYNHRGQKTREWGQTVYPVEYVYDDQGRLHQQKTYASSAADFTGATWPSSPGTAQTTTWHHHASTGLVTSKVDAASQSVGYTYTAAGQLKTRTWARGTVTTYDYDPATGELTDVTYSDSTPALAYTYNRLGQTATVADYTGTRTFTYNLGGTLELQREDLPAFFGSRRLTYEYDTAAGTKGRPTAFKLGHSGDPAHDQHVTYGYQADGRLTTIAAAGQSFSYGYVANSHLVGTITNSAAGYSDTRVYDPKHPWVDSRATMIGTVTKAAFAYTQDTLGRVTQAERTGELFERYGDGTQGLKASFGYNDRSELTSETIYLGGTSTVLTGRDDAYTYDLLGNRKTATHNGEVATYTPNSLNQYTHRTVPRVHDVSGAADVGYNVTVTTDPGVSASTQPPVTRHGEYFFQSRALVPTGAVHSALLIEDDGAPPFTSAGNFYLAGTPEAFTYDADGNLKSDGRWTYGYDAENRLGWIQASSAAVAAGYPNEAYHILHDYLGRRVIKQPYLWNGTGWAGNGAQERYLYNGWNLIARLDDMTLTKSICWGLDLSGSMAGAGGIGGLLLVREGGESYLPAYDALGNIHAMIQASDGSIAAGYEYDAYGKTLRESGPYAEANPFRFATKYTDLDTELVYHDTRYYSPSLGRFINRDSIGEQGGLNLYAYVSNRVPNAWDYLGMFNAEDMPSGRPEVLLDGGGGSLPASSSLGALMQAFADHKAKEEQARQEAIKRGLVEMGYTYAEASEAVAAYFNGTLFQGSGGDGKDLQKLKTAQEKLDSGETVTITDANGNSMTFQPGQVIALNGSGGVMGFAPNNTAVASGGSALGNALRNVPLIGGILGGVGDVVAGVGNTAFGIATFGQSGTFGRGIGQIGYGIGGTANILARDVAATVVGAYGTVVTTATAVADVVTFGNVVSGGNPLKAIGNLIANVAIPEYGMFGGLGWGTTQGRGPGSILNQGDLASYHHDRNLNEIEWIKRNYTTRPDATWVGPVGAAYALVGTIPFGIKGLIDGERYP